MIEAIVDGRYIVISSDCHAGASQEDYRPYLAAAWHDDFDRWVGTYTMPFADLISPEADRSWNHERRLADLERDGIVAEVVFPNTVPPFFSLKPPTSEDCVRRWAGLQAHNRWLADFCSMAPGRRAGVAQVMLHDVEATVREVEWVHQAGLLGGILLPTVLVNDPLIAPLFAPEYDPVWAACADLGVPIHTHGGIMSEAWGVGRYPAAGAVYISETSYFTHRALTHLILGGVFERHPELRLVMTEQGTGWVPGTLASLDALMAGIRAKPDSPSGLYGAPVAAELKLKPSEYFDRNCAIGASFLRRGEAQRRHEVGLHAIMWGSDYPHNEGTNPFTSEALRWTFADIDPAEVAAMLGGNAARVYGFDLEQLAQVAAKVGPEVDAVSRPLTEIPASALTGAFSG